MYLKKKYYMTFKQAGFTLMETMLVIAIATSITVCALLLGQKIMDYSKVQQSKETVKLIVSDVQSRFSTQENYATFSGMSDFSWLKSVEVDNNVIKGPWGPVSLNSETQTNPNDAWSLEFSNVPSSGCMSLVSGVSSQFFQTKVNGVLNLEKGPGVSVDPVEAESLCNLTNNTVRFIVKSFQSNASPVSPNSNPAPTPGLPVWSPI